MLLHDLLLVQNQLFLELLAGLPLLGSLQLRLLQSRLRLPKSSLQLSNPIGKTILLNRYALYFATQVHLLSL